MREKDCLIGLQVFKGEENFDQNGKLKVAYFVTVRSAKENKTTVTWTIFSSKKERSKKNARMIRDRHTLMIGLNCSLLVTYSEFAPSKFKSDRNQNP